MIDPASLTKAQLHELILETEHRARQGDAYRAGTIRDEHLDLFARIWTKPALRPFLTRDLTALIGFTHNDWPTCNTLFQTWEVLIDPIDPNEYAERAHTDRSLTFTSPEARGRIGDTATMEDLHRNDTQRRHDDLFRLIHNGIGADPATARPATSKHQPRPDCSPEPNGSTS